MSVDALIFPGIFFFLFQNSIKVAIQSIRCQSDETEIVWGGRSGKQMKNTLYLIREGGDE